MEEVKQDQSPLHLQLQLHTYTCNVLIINIYTQQALGALGIPFAFVKYRFEYLQRSPTHLLNLHSQTRTEGEIQCADFSERSEFTGTNTVTY